MKTFEFSDQILNSVLNELNQAKAYIKIAMFQIHLGELFDLLEKKIAEGVRVEIFTLPFDSINESLRTEVIPRFEQLKNSGAKIDFCKWNVGDPERTTTAVGKWYSFHGKFIVTDKSAIILSANFTIGNELDACLIIKNEIEIIKNFNAKYEELRVMFVTEKNGYSGSIREMITNSARHNIRDFFELPRVIQSTTHKKHWIRHYPSLICPENLELNEGLYLVPFDIRGRHIYKKVLSEAEEFIFISAESFTDPKFGLDIRNLKANKNMNIKILTGSTSMDFSDRIQKMYREILAEDIQLFTLNNELHAKILITEKYLLIGSINLNKMNLGFNISRKYWRGNTETFYITKDIKLIKEAKIKFENQLNQSIPMESKLAEKIKIDASNILKSSNIRSNKVVKNLFSKFILLKEIELKKDAKKLVNLTKKLMLHYKIKIANEEIFIMSIILFFIKYRKRNTS